MTQRCEVKRGRGRPRVESPMVQISIRINQDLLDAVDALADQNPEHDRASVMRDLIRRGLAQRR